MNSGSSFVAARVLPVLCVLGACASGPQPGWWCDMVPNGMQGSAYHGDLVVELIGARTNGGSGAILYCRFIGCEFANMTMDHERIAWDVLKGRSGPMIDKFVLNISAGVGNLDRSAERFNLVESNVVMIELIGDNVVMWHRLLVCRESGLAWDGVCRKRMSD